MASNQANVALSTMSQQEREQLAKQLEDDLEAYISSLERAPRRRSDKDRWTEENWEEEMEKHPFFAKQVNPESSDMSPLMEGISALKFSPDENTNEELAENYKKEGNFLFKSKKYRLAIENYTEGLKLKVPDSLLCTQLLTNRAAAHFHLGNYRSSLTDCQRALRVTRDHSKALLRAAQCTLKLKRTQECVEWCERGLMVLPNDATLLEMRREARDLQKVLDRDERRRIAKEKKQQKEDEKLLDAIRSRGISIHSKPFQDDDAEGDGGDALDLASLEATHPAALNKKVHFVDAAGQSKLAWPVIFLYPEYAETDFIEEFIEDQTFEDHLMNMFGPGMEPPPWDEDRKYHPDNMKIYFEDQLNIISDPKLVSVQPQSSLLQVLKDPRFKVRGGTPAFVILVDNSAFQSQFLSKYKF